MSQRVEASVARDYSFGFVLWNYMFRSSLNLSQSLYAYERKNGKAAGAQFTPQDIENGAVAIAQALWGKYKDVTGKLQTVNGDITKVSFVPGLSEAAHVLLKQKSTYLEKITWDGRNAAEDEVHNSSVSNPLRHSYLRYFFPRRKPEFVDDQIFTHSQE